MTLCQTSCERKGLADILLFQIGEIREQFGDGTAGGESFDDHANARIPRMQGFPPITSGFIVIRSNPRTLPS